MAITSKLHEMTLATINEEIEAAGVSKIYKQLPHGRKALARLVTEGKALYVGEGEFVDQEALDAVIKAENDAKVKTKAVKPEATPKVMVYPELPESNRVGTAVFCRYGRQTILSIGHYEGEPTRIRALLSNDKIVSLSSCRAAAVQSQYRSRYPVDRDHKTASGKPSIGVEDSITDLLKGSTVADIESICAENSLAYDRWASLNPGMQRMCLGNRLRGMAQRGKRVVIRGTVVHEGAEETAPAAPAPTDTGAVSQAA